MKISVFGSSHPKPGDLAYEEALRLGRLLGSNGHTVLTGGYIGTMEAVSRGAASTGALVIGVTCDQIEAWRPVRPNPWVMEERRYPTLPERVIALIEGCDAAFGLPGGPGTLTEIAMMWNLLITDSITPRPLILIGVGWYDTFDTLLSRLGEYIPENQRRWLTFAPDIRTGYQLLNELR
jgi:hypothetical protein